MESNPALGPAWVARIRGTALAGVAGGRIDRRH